MDLHDLGESESPVGDGAGRRANTSLFRTAGSWKRRDSLLLGLIVCLALVMRLVYVFQMRANPLFERLILDAEVHDSWARAILEGRSYFDGAYFKAPLYPYFLASIYTLAGPSLLAARLVQAVLGAASCGLVFALGREAFDRRVGALAGFTAAVYWVMIYFDGEILLEPLSAFLSLLGLWLLTCSERKRRTRELSAAGLAFGLSAITRPNVLAFLPFAALWLLYTRYRKWGDLRRVLPGVFVFGLACLAPILPVTLRNYAAEGDFVLIASQAGPNFYIGNNPVSDGRSAFIFGARGTWEAGVGDWVRMAESARGRKLTSSEVSQYFFEKSFEFIKDSPGRFAALLWHKTMLFFYEWEIPNLGNPEFSTLRYAPFVRVLPLTTGLLLSLGLLGAVCCMGDGARRFPIWSYALIYSATVIVFFVCARFRMPVMPFFIVLAASVPFRFAGALRSRNWILAAGLLIAFATLYAFVNRGVPPEWVAKYAARSHSATGTVLVEAGRAEEAEAEFRSALEIDPNSSDAERALATSAHARGDCAAAIPHYRRSIALRPERGAHLALARCLIQQKSWHEAADVLRRGMHVAPYFFQQQRELAYILAICPTEDLCDGKEALALADEALRLGDVKAKGMGARAAALARLGRFEEAVEEVERALLLARSSADLQAISRLAAQAEKHRRGQPLDVDSYRRKHRKQ